MVAICIMTIVIILLYYYDDYYIIITSSTRKKQTNAWGRRSCTQNSLPTTTLPFTPSNTHFFCGTGARAVAS